MAKRPQSSPRCPGTHPPESHQAFASQSHDQDPAHLEPMPPVPTAQTKFKGCYEAQFSYMYPVESFAPLPRFGRAGPGSAEPGSCSGRGFAAGIAGKPKDSQRLLNGIIMLGQKLTNLEVAELGHQGVGAQ